MVQSASSPSFASQYPLKQPRQQVKFGFSPEEKGDIAVASGVSTLIAVPLWDGIKAGVKAIHRKRTKQPTLSKQLTALDEKIKKFTTTTPKNTEDFKDLKNLSFAAIGTTVAMGVIGLLISVIKK